MTKTGSLSEEKVLRILADTRDLFMSKLKTLDRSISNGHTGCSGARKALDDSLCVLSSNLSTLSLGVNT